jgi:hypothetical protein
MGLEKVSFVPTTDFVLGNNDVPTSPADKRMEAKGN